MRALYVSLCAVAAIVLLAGPVQATTGGQSCHKINAKGIGQDLGGGSTTAQIMGGGFLHGTTAGTFAIVGGAPPAFAIAGTVVFTTNAGTLTVGVSGTFDVSTGAFSATGPVTSSTGKLEGATGSLTLEGVQDLGTGAFTETVTGSICVDLSP
jgi:hypothetical protein